MHIEDSDLKIGDIVWHKYGDRIDIPRYTVSAINRRITERTGDPSVSVEISYDLFCGSGGIYNIKREAIIKLPSELMAAFGL